MPISDTYIVEYLLQGSLLQPEPWVVWRERPMDRGGYVAHVEDVHIEIEHACFRTGSLLFLRVRHGDEEFKISEPLPQGWFGQQYATEDEHCLAQLLRGLMRAAALQCRNRRLHAEENADRVRDRLCRRLLFNQSGLDPLRIPKASSSAMPAQIVAPELVK